MAELNEGARWAMDRVTGWDPVQPRWDGPAVVTAMHRYLIGLGLPKPEWVRVAGCMAEALELSRRHRCAKSEYEQHTHQRVTGELNLLDTVSIDRFEAATDGVVAHPLLRAMVAAGGGWSRMVSGTALSVTIELGIAVGARAVPLSGDLIWLWDQIMTAFECGLGWFTLTEDGLILIPRPAMVMPRGRLHCVEGPAVLWRDGSAQYFFEGVEFTRAEHQRLVSRTMTAEEAFAFRDPDQELVAMGVAPPGDVLARLGGVLLDTGVRGTRLYRVDGHFTHRQSDYCITMTDPSTGRQYLEWVDPEIGVQGDAELCQAHLFGIDLRDWLSLRTEA